MKRVFSAPAAVFFVLEFAIHFADVFARPVVVALAHGALETDKIWLGHNFILINRARLKKDMRATSRDRTADLILTMDALCQLS